MPKGFFAPGYGRAPHSPAVVTDTTVHNPLVVITPETKVVATATVISTLPSTTITGEGNLSVNIGQLMMAGAVLSGGGGIRT